MNDPFNLQRFIDAQASTFETAILELKSGCKKTHWMWFIFPQFAGLGTSPNARFYAIGSLGEAAAYWHHPVLGPRLRQCVETLAGWSTQRTAEEILGALDALKFRSSLTLFACLQRGEPFERALDLFFNSEPDQRTLAMLNGPA